MGWQDGRIDRWKGKRIDRWVAMKMDILWVYGRLVDGFYEWLGG